MLAQATPPVQDDRSLPAADPVVGVGVVRVAQPEGGGGVGNVREPLAIKPVQPRGAQPLVVQAAHSDVEESGVVALVGEIEGDVVGQVALSHVCGDLRVGVFPRLDAGERVEVEGGAQAVPAQPGQVHGGRVEQHPVPRVPGPPDALSRLIMHAVVGLLVEREMPVPTQQQQQHNAQGLATTSQTVPY